MEIDNRQLRSIAAVDERERDFFVYSQQDLRVVGGGCLFADDAVFGAKWIFNVMNECLMMFMGNGDL